MASLSKERGRDSWKLAWIGPDKRRRAIRLGSMPKKTAEQFRVRFEELLGVRRGGGLMPESLMDWLDGLADELRTRLADAGLIDPVERMNLGGLCTAFLESRSSVAPATQTRDQQVTKRLLEHFGPDRSLDSISVRDAEQWRKELAESGNKRDVSRETLGDNTVRRRTGVARQIFATAVRWGLIRSNPFDGLATTVRENRERQHFVRWQDIVRVIDHAPTQQWKSLIAFCRLAGPRVPSELSELTWNDIDFAARMITLRSPKTRHHGGEHVMRTVPLFPELMPYLQALADEVGPGIDVPLSALVFPMAADPTNNLRTRFSKYIIRAGLQPWEKLFQNMRSSRVTELLAQFPATDVCRWMGHSPSVAARFYAQAQPEIAERAATVSTVGAGAPAGANGGTLGAHTGAITDLQERVTSLRNLTETIVSQALATAAGPLVTLPEGGKEWAMRDSNPRPSRCKRDALAN
jgi:integrase